MLVYVVDDDEELIEDLKKSTNLTENECIARESSLEIFSVNSPSALMERINSISDSPEQLPNLIFLDLKFKKEKHNGIDALVFLKEHKIKVIRLIPVLMYSSSTEKKDIKDSYRKQVNEYIAKGDDEINQFWKAIKYWHATAKMPAYG